MKRIVYILLLCLTGCLPDSDKPKLTPSQADRLALELMAVQINTAQTNWTVLIVPRTNLWPSSSSTNRRSPRN